MARHLVQPVTAVAFAFAALVGCAAHTDAPALPGALSSLAAGTAVRPHWTKTSIGKFADPYGVAVDAAGNVLVADPGSKSVLLVRPNGTRETIGDFALEVGSKFDPQGVSIAPGEYLAYVADRGSRSIWYVKPNNTVGRVSGPTALDSLYPRGVAYAAGAGGVYAGLVTTLPLSRKGVVRCVALSCPIFASREFDNPYGVAVDNRGTVFVADAGAKAVYRIDASGSKAIGTFADPYGVAVSPDGSTVYVADAGAKKVYQGKPDGSSWTDIGTFGDPYGVAAAPNGDVYVADPGSKDVWKLTP